MVAGAGATVGYQGCTGYTFSTSGYGIFQTNTGSTLICREQTFCARMITNFTAMVKTGIIESWLITESIHLYLALFLLFF